MEESPRKKRRRSEEPRAGSSLMDTAREGFVRHLALAKWREIEDIRESLGCDWTRAVSEAGQFPGRGPYRALWARRWQEQVLPHATGTDSGALFAAVERAVAAALQDEGEQRKNRGDRPLDEDPEYREFLGGLFRQLSRASSEELELS